MYRFLTLLAVMATNVVMADPVYLNCDITEEGKNKSFTVKLDEDSGKISHTNSSGSGFNTEGFFSPNEITYQNIIVTQGIKITYKYVIDRTTLVVNKHFRAEVLDEKLGIPPEVHPPFPGLCAIADVSNRKI